MIHESWYTKTCFKKFSIRFDCDKFLDGSIFRRSFRSNNEVRFDGHGSSMRRRLCRGVQSYPVSRQRHETRDVKSVHNFRTADNTLIGKIFLIKNSNTLDKLYFRWLENSVIEIGKAASIALISNHLNWSPVLALRVMTTTKLRKNCEKIVFSSYSNSFFTS